MMGDMADTFNAMKSAKKEHRAKMLEQANTTGWTAHTPYHFSKVFNGFRFDWWPSAGKAQYLNKMIYGRGKVNAMIKKLSETSIQLEDFTLPPVNLPVIGRAK